MTKSSKFSILSIVSAVLLSTSISSPSFAEGAAAQAKHLQAQRLRQQKALANQQRINQQRRIQAQRAQQQQRQQQAARQQAKPTHQQKNLTEEMKFATMLVIAFDHQKAGQPLTYAQKAVIQRFTLINNLVQIVEATPARQQLVANLRAQQQRQQQAAQQQRQPQQRPSIAEQRNNDIYRQMTQGLMDRSHMWAMDKY